MEKAHFLWTTDGAGHHLAHDDHYSVTVERLLPASEAEFQIWRMQRDPRELVASGIRVSAQAAMLAAEETATAMHRHA